MKGLLVKNSLFLLITATISLSAMEDSSIIKINAIQKSHRLGDVSLYKDREGFHIVHQNKISTANPALIDPILNKMTPKQLINFQKHGYIDITQTNDGSYALRAKVRGNGGGPATANFFYWLTKSVAYGGIIAATGTAMVATGGAAAAAVGVGTVTGSMAGGAAGGAAIAYASGTVTGLATVGANAAAGGIMASATATAAASTTIAATASSGIGLFTAIESAALGLAAIGLALPTP
jgi:hypothetical protein